VVAGGVDRWGVGSALLFGALFSPVFADPGYDAGLASADAGDLGDSSDGDSSDGDYEVGGNEDSGDAVDSFDDGGDSFSDLGGGDFGGGDF
jgi:hypothetical protein